MDPLSHIRAAWLRACDDWDRARCADWHPAKEAEVAAARRACREARRAYDRAWIVCHAPAYAAQHGITA